MNGYDGPTLRSVRESAGVPLRRVARQANMSHGHLSKVERGEPGRPVTPAVLAAYEKATGIHLTGAAGHTPGNPLETNTWRRGHLSEARRRTLNAKVAAVAVGGPLTEQLTRILDATGRPVIPDRIEEPDTIQLEAAAALTTRIDLRYGGGVADQMARALLRWAIGLLEVAETTTDTGARLHAALAALAQRAGWAAFDANTHDIARSLFTIALYAANRAQDPDLQAHVIADFAAQHNHLGYPDDALHVVRFGEVDERVSPHVRTVIHCLKARAYALRGDTDACQRHIHLAETTHTDATTQPTNGWQDTIATTAHLFAGTGHATATLARRTGSPAVRHDAQHRLTQAIEALDPTHQARPTALCMAQLATLHLETGDLDTGTHWARQLLHAAPGIRSHRLTEHLAMIRTAVDRRAGDPAVSELAEEIRYGGEVGGTDDRRHSGDAR